MAPPSAPAAREPPSGVVKLAARLLRADSCCIVPPPSVNSFRSDFTSAGGTVTVSGWTKSYGLWTTCNKHHEVRESKPQPRTGRATRGRTAAGGGNPRTPAAAASVRLSPDCTLGVSSSSQRILRLVVFRSEVDPTSAGGQMELEHLLSLPGGALLLSRSERAPRSGSA